MFDPQTGKIVQYLISFVFSSSINHIMTPQIYLVTPLEGPDP